MTSKTATLTTLDISVTATTKSEIRAVMLQHWNAEKPGTSSERNKYRYNVETLSNGKRIFLTRPTRLNKGCDFVIVCEQPIISFKNGNPKPPSQKALISELQELVKICPSVSGEILKSVRRVWDCEDVDMVFNSLKLVIPSEGCLRAERALKICNWLFIEQDVTYWTESGREMLRNAIEAQLGRLP